VARQDASADDEDRRGGRGRGGSPAGYAYGPGGGGPLLGMGPPGGVVGAGRAGLGGLGRGRSAEDPGSLVALVCGSSRQPGLVEVWMWPAAAASFYDV
jgi:hypothetical protein